MELEAAKVEELEEEEEALVASIPQRGGTATGSLPGLYFLVARLDFARLMAGPIA